MGRLEHKKNIKINYRRRVRKDKKYYFIQCIYFSLVIFMLAGIVFLAIKLVSMVSDYNLVSDVTGPTEVVSLNDIVSQNSVVNDSHGEGPEEVPELRETTSTATSIELSWADTSGVGYIVKYRLIANSNGEHHGKTYTEDGSRAMDNICTACFEGADTSEIENSEHGWLVKEVNEPSIALTGLHTSSEYEIHIEYNNESEEEYLPSFIVATGSNGYCDPFMGIDCILNISDRDSMGNVISRTASATVTASSADGCIGVEAKPIMGTSFYDDPELSSKTIDLTAGTKLTIIDNEEGNHCYLSPSGQWALYAEDEEGNKGWVNARTLLIDVKALFEADNYIYGIQTNRTNAYSSIFTSGGNAHAVNTSDIPETRYDSISVNDINYYLYVDGYNVIDGITGEALPNYGSPYQMPVIWDLALELIQCQKNALENGYTLLMYEGYRPASTSLAVSGQLSGLGYLSTEAYGTNLAQGFLVGGSYNVSYYIAQKSRHNRGTATDITLMRFNSIDELGEEIEVQTKMHTLDFRCNMQFNTWEADLLTDIMIGHGSNLEYLSIRSEWWHFQLKNDRTDLYPLISLYGYSDIVF